MGQRGITRILQITSYPPPRAGWGVRVQFLKRALEALGDECVVMNVGTSRRTPSPEYETVMGGLDYVRKVWRFSARGYTVHMHVNGDSPKGFVLALLAQAISIATGKRGFLTFHAGTDQIYFPRTKAPLLYPMYRVLFGVPKAIVCNSEAVRRLIADYGVPARKIVAIPAFSRQYLDFSPVDLPADTEAFYRRTPQVVFTYIRIRDGFFLETLLEGFAKVAQRVPDAGLAFCGVSGDIDQPLLRMVEEKIDQLNLRDRICLIDDLDHDQFLTALTRARLYLRTPVTDGVASSVLESLALRVPVVAAENGTRPAGTIVYRASDADDLAETVVRVLSTREDVARRLPSPEIADTVATEVALLRS